MNIIENKDLLLKTVKALRGDIDEKAKRDKQRQLFSDHDLDAKEMLCLLVSLIKIPTIPKDGKAKSIIIRSRVPHCFVDDTTHVLLIARDVRKFAGPKGDPTQSVLACKNYLKKHGADHLVTEVISLSELMYEYKDFEAKRNLAKRVDVVLCDFSIQSSVPAHLGKPFYAARKKPIAVNLKSKYLRRALKRALSTSYLNFQMSGNCGMGQVGRLNQSDVEIAENIAAATKGWKTGFPGGWKNVRSICLKTDASIAVPLYRSDASANSIKAVKHPNNFRNRVVANDHISTMDDNYMVAVRKSGLVTVRSKKKLNSDAFETTEAPKKGSKLVETKKARINYKKSKKINLKFAHKPKPSIVETKVKQNKEKIRVKNSKVPLKNKRHPAKAK